MGARELDSVKLGPISLAGLGFGPMAVAGSSHARSPAGLSAGGRAGGPSLQAAAHPGLSVHGKRNIYTKPWLACFTRGHILVRVDSFRVHVGIDFNPTGLMSIALRIVYKLS